MNEHNIFSPFPAHTCHAKGCTKLCRDETAFCVGHQRILPRLLQSMLALNYDRTRQITDQPSPAYRLAHDAAINVLAEHEGYKEPEA